MLTSSISGVMIAFGKIEYFACALPAGMLYSFQKRKEYFRYEFYCRTSCLWGGHDLMFHVVPGVDGSKSIRYLGDSEGHPGWNKRLVGEPVI